MGPSAETTALMEAYIELQKPIYHTPINLEINKFKREVRKRFSSKVLQSKLIRAYKKRSWMEYEGVARHRGNFPTHPAYGKKLNITGAKDEESPVHEIKVKNGQQ